MSLNEAEIHPKVDSIEDKKYHLLVIVYEYCLVLLYTI